MKRDLSSARRAAPAAFALVATVAGAASGPAAPMPGEAGVRVAAAGGAADRAAPTSAGVAAAGDTRPRRDGGQQPAALDAPGDASRGASTVPAFRSALDGYRRYDAGEPLRPWHELNDEVGAVGGHGGALGAKPAEAAADDVQEPPK